MAWMALPELPEDLISIATGRPIEVSRAPATVSVVTREDIEILGAATLDEVMETVAGVHVSLGSFMLSPVYVFRGLFTDRNPQVLVMVDGVPLNQLFFGNWGVRPDLPLENVERIEIIRGPGSALYGADAFAGVVNIITVQGGREAGVRLGETLNRAWVLASKKRGRWLVSASAMLGRSIGDRGREMERDAQSIFDGLFGTSASQAPGPLEMGQKRLDLRLDVSGGRTRLSLWRARQMDVGLGAGGNLALDPGGRGDADLLIALLDHEWRPAQHWSVDVRLSRYEVSMGAFQHLFPPGAILPLGEDGNIDPRNPVAAVPFPEGVIGHPIIEERRTAFKVEAVFSGFRFHTLRAGAGMAHGRMEAEEEKNFGPGVLAPPFPPEVGGGLVDVTGTASAFVTNKTRVLRYAFLQDEWAFAPDFEATIGARYDSYSDFGSTFNPRISIIWQASPFTSLKMLAGKAFRAPSFSELYLKNNPVSIGNPDLSPERMRSVEIGIDHDDRLLSWKVTGYTYWADDLIEFSGAKAENAGQVRGRGIELEWRWRPSRRFTLWGNQAFMSTRDEKAGRELTNAPRYTGFLAARIDLPQGWSIAPRIEWVGDRPRAPGDPRDALEGYALVHMTLRRRSLGWEAGLGIRNLFDADAREPSPFDPRFGVPPVPEDFPLPGRTFSTWLQVRF